jgi:hypothetical protein
MLIRRWSSGSGTIGLLIEFIFLTIFPCASTFPLLQYINTSNSSLSQRFPDAIIIGVKKCGTRALLEFLKLNPKIKAPGPEVHFFDKNYDLGYDWYR